MLNLELLTLMLKKGATVTVLSQAGVPPAALAAAGVTPASLKEAGMGAAVVFDAFRKAGRPLPLADMLQAFPPGDLWRLYIYSRNEWLAAGITARQLLDGGVRWHELVGMYPPEEALSTLDLSSVDDVVSILKDC